jgi:hypothetical protein
MNNMGREIMAALKRFQVGSDGDGVTVGGALVVSGATTANTFTASGPSVISVNSASDALRITQVGAGNALVVEDEANPDATPTVIDSSGRLVVGDTTARTSGSPGNPTPPLQVVGNTYTTSGTGLFHYQDGAPNASFLSFNKSRGSSLGTQTIVADGDRLGGIEFLGSDGTAFVPAARIDAYVIGTPGTDDMPGRLVFSTTADGASNVSEAARITDSGAVLVGTTSTPTKAGSGYVVAASGQIIGIGSASAGLNQTYVGLCNNVTATTGTIVFTFNGLAIAANRSCLVKLTVTQSPNNSATTASHVAAEYWFQLFNSSAGVCQRLNAATQYEAGYVYATHFAFADLGGASCTVTLTNPTAASLTNGSYKVEIQDPRGNWYLDSVTTT